MKNNFLEKLYRKCGGGTISKPFSKKSKLIISLNQQSKVLYSLFSLYATLKAIQVKKLSCRPLAFNSYKSFFKKQNKERPETSQTSLPASFSAWFLKKNIFIVIFY